VAAGDIPEDQGRHWVAALLVLGADGIEVGRVLAGLVKFHVRDDPDRAGHLLRGYFKFIGLVEQ